MEPGDVADRLAIHDLHARYNWAVDSADGVAFAATFTPDGAFIGSMSELRGTAALAAFAASEALDARGIQHWNANLLIDFVGADEARSRSYMLALAPTGGAPAVERAGRYDDRLVRTAGGWRFAQRRFFRQAAR